MRAALAALVLAAGIVAPSGAQSRVAGVTNAAGVLLDAADAYVEAAEARWEQEFEGRLARRDGTPRTHDEILQPLAQARRQLAELRRGLTPDADAAAHEEAAMVATELHWQLALEEARRHVEAFRSRAGMVGYETAGARLLRERDGLVDRIGALVDLARAEERELSWEAWIELADATLDVRDGDELASQLDDFLRAAHVVHTDAVTGDQQIYDMSHLFEPLALQPPSEQPALDPYPVGGPQPSRRVFGVFGLSLDTTNTIDGRYRVLRGLADVDSFWGSADTDDLRLLMVLGDGIFASEPARVRLEEDDPWMNYDVISSLRSGRTSDDREVLLRDNQRRQLPYRALQALLEAEAPNPDVAGLLLALDQIAIVAVPEPGAMPGRRTFRLQGEEVSWVYGRSDDAPAAVGALRLLRPLPTGELVDVASLFDGDRVVVELELDRAIEADTLDVSAAELANGADDVRPFDWSGSSGVTLRRVEGAETVFRSDVLFLPTALTGEPQRDPARMLDLTPGATLLLALPPSTPIVSAPVAARFVEDPGRIGRSGWSLFQAACKVAGVDPQSDDVKSTQESGRISTGSLFSGSTYDVVVSLGDHAALLLVRDEIRRGLEAERGRLGTFLQEIVRDPELAQRWLELDLRAEVASGRRALATLPIQVGGVAGNTLAEALAGLPSDPDTRRVQAVAIARAVASEAYAAVGDALETCRGTADDDLEGLIGLAGAGLDPLRRSSAPDLVERVRLGDGLWWVPERRVRLHFGTIEQLHRQLTDGEALKDAHRDVCLAVASMGALTAEIYAVRASAMALHRLASGMRGAALALETVGLGDSLFRKLPQALEQRADVRFARGTMGVLAHQRFDEAAARVKPAWMLCAEIAAGGFGLGAEAVALSRSLRLVDEVGETRALLARLEADGLDGFRALDPPEQERILATLAAAGEGPALRTPLLRNELRVQAKSVLRRLEEDLEVRALDRWWDQDWFRGFATAPEVGGTELLEAGRARSRPDYFPDASGGLSIHSGSVQHTLGERLGEGVGAAVHAVQDEPGVVAKLLKETDLDLADEAIDMAEDAGALLAEANVPHLPIVGRGRNGPLTFLLQERLPPDARVLRFRRTPRPDGNGVFLDGIEGYDPGARLPRAFQRALLRLYQRMGKAGLVWEDGHLENVYFVGKGLRWEAGILDLDRIGRFGGEQYEVGDPLYRAMTMAGFGGERVRSMHGAPLLGRGAWPNMLDAEFAMQKMLEYQRYIAFDPATQTWTGRLLDLDVVEGYFPGFRSHLGPRLEAIAKGR
jgi:hypothetical protein